MKPIKSIILILSVLIFISVNPLIGYAEQYLCVEEYSAGFIYDKKSKEWRTATFKATDKYIISVDDTLKISEFIVKKVGKTGVAFYCNDGFKDGRMCCQDFWSPAPSEFCFNRNNGRFISTDTYGYYMDDSNNDTPHIEIGKCSPF